MIGDWVMETNHGQMGRVTYLDANPDCSRIDIQREDGGGFPCSIDIIRPIPLTAEILEKNGFAKKLNKHCYHDEDTRILIEYYKGCILIDITVNEYCEDEVTYSLPEPYYVHQLQHALHLCGLNELADNFKI